MTTPLKLVPFSAEHQVGVLDLIVPIQREEFGIDIRAEDQPDLIDIPNFYQQGNGQFWLALTETDEVIGSIALLDIGTDQVALRKMFVRADYRGKTYGTAQRLLDTALGWSAQRSVRELFLGTTSAFLAAHRFYEKNGFTEISQSKLPPSFPVMKVDTKFYHRQP